MSEVHGSGMLVGLVMKGGVTVGRVLAVEATALAAETAERHLLGDEPARRRAAEGVLAAVLLSAHIKGEERLLVDLRGRGWTFTGEVRGDGAVRASLEPADVPAQERLVGRLTAVKWNAVTEVYRGVAAVDHADMQSVLEDYLQASQQTEGLVRLAVRVEGEITRAVGVLLERFPSDEDGPWHALAEAVRGLDAESLVEGIRVGVLPGHTVEVLDVRQLVWSCPCSLERVEGMLASLGPEELQSMATDPGQAEVTCHFCRTKWTVLAPRLLTLAAGLRGAVGIS